MEVKIRKEANNKQKKNRAILERKKKMDFVTLFVPFFILKLVIKLKYPNSLMIRSLFHATLHHPHHHFYTHPHRH